MPPGNIEVLTDDEKEALRLTGDLGNLLRRIIQGPQGMKDWDEAAGHLHVLQRMIGAQAAARAYPGSYRLLGQSLPPREPNGYQSMTSEPFTGHVDA